MYTHFLSTTFCSQIIKIGFGWEEDLLHEHCNPYVEELCDRCAKLWLHLSTSSQKIESPLLDLVWENIIVAGFLSLLEGFSKIIPCSTEGRALMSMDLATYASEMKTSAVMERIENAFDEQANNSTDMKKIFPPTISPVRGMQYVDIYIKVFYFDKEVCY